MSIRSKKQINRRKENKKDRVQSEKGGDFQTITLQKITSKLL